MGILRLFRDGSRLEFGKGHLDQWSVYLARPLGAKLPAAEAESLERLERLGRAICPRALYEDFIVVYNRTTHEVQPHVFDLIHFLARVYGEHSLDVEVAVALAYAGMIALERRHRSRPGMKRQRRLSIHLVLVEGSSAAGAVNFARGKSWEQITAACVSRGF